MDGAPANRILGLVAIAAALAAIFLWVPLDTDTSLIEKVRRQVSIGDALAPTVAAAFVLLGGGLLVIVEGGRADTSRLTRANGAYLATLILWFALCLAVMRWLGPAVVALLAPGGEDAASYRALRDTAPWKYIGYLAGGTLLVGGTIAWVEGRPSLRAVLIGAAATLAMIALYDLPFDDLLLPPNGDV